MERRTLLQGGEVWRDGITPHDGSAVKNIICEPRCRRHDARIELSTPTAL
jgi:hypothetical protein